VSDYRPTLSAQEAENIRLWHERAYAARMAEGGGGRMLIFFGASGDLGYLKQLMAAEGFGATVVAHEELTRGDRWVEYFTFLAA
jgi:release factor glutamine methyltransferase